MYIKHLHNKKGNESSTHSSWRSMLSRVYYDSKNKEIYKKYYCDKGIGVCSRWTEHNGFLNFLNDMGERPIGTSLDRIDPMGDYEPSNCRWAVHTTQMRNRGFNRLITYNGETKCITEWAEVLNIPFPTLFQRIYRGWKIDDIISKPNGYKNKLNKDLAISIRNSNLKSSELATIYSVSSRTIRDVRNNKTWRI